MNSGVDIRPSVLSQFDHKEMTRYFMRQQIQMETYFINAAKLMNRDVLIVTDRGTMDSMAYLASKEDFQKVCKEEQWTLDYLTNERYDMVCHMVTAADGALDFYSSESNALRYETAEQAIALDKKIQNVWLNQESLCIFDNNVKSFDEKLQNVFVAIGRLTGHNPALKMLKKYLLPKDFDISQIPKHIEMKSYRDAIRYLVNDTPKECSIYVKEKVNEDG